MFIKIRAESIWSSKLTLGYSKMRKRLLRYIGFGCKNFKIFRHKVLIYWLLNNTLFIRNMLRFFIFYKKKNPVF